MAINTLDALSDAAAAVAMAMANADAGSPDEAAAPPTSSEQHEHEDKASNKEDEDMRETEDTTSCKDVNVSSHPNGLHQDAIDAQLQSSASVNHHHAPSSSSNNPGPLGQDSNNSSNSSSSNSTTTTIHASTALKSSSAYTNGRSPAIGKFNNSVNAQRHRHHSHHLHSPPASTVTSTEAEANLPAEVADWSEHQQQTSSLKRPFSRVDVLLEAAASPHHEQQEAHPSPPPPKQAKTKKSPKTSLTGSSLQAHGSSSGPPTPASSNGNSNNNNNAIPTSKKSSYQGPKISMACYSCRNSKTRCSGTIPCNRCNSKNMNCEYPLRDGRTANRSSVPDSAGAETPSTAALTAISTASSSSSMAAAQSAMAQAQAKAKAAQAQAAIASSYLGYDSDSTPRGPMQRFNDAFALPAAARGLAASASTISSLTAAVSHATPPSVFQHHPPSLSLSAGPTSSRISPSSTSSYARSTGLAHSTNAGSRHSPAATGSPGYEDYMPTTSGSTTSRTHMSLPLNCKGTSKSPENTHLDAPVQDSARSRPCSQPGSRPSTASAAAGASSSTSTSKASGNVSGVDEHAQQYSTRDRSHSYPHPVPGYIKDYVPLPPLLSTSLDPGLLHNKRSIERDTRPEHVSPHHQMRDLNALQLHNNDQRRPVNAFGLDDEGGSGRYNRSLTSGLPFPFGPMYLGNHHYASRLSARHPSPPRQHYGSQARSPRSEQYQAHQREHQLPPLHATTTTRQGAVKQESVEGSPRIDELAPMSSMPPSSHPKLSEEQNEPDVGMEGEAEAHTDADADAERGGSTSRASPPSTTSTSATSLSMHGSANGSTTKHGESDARTSSIGPAYMHSNQLPPILGVGGLPDTLLPWSALLLDAGIPDLETLKVEIPFEAVKRYVDCLAESWPDVLPTFTKRFQLRYAIEDALTRACRETPNRSSSMRTLYADGGREDTY